MKISFLLQLVSFSVLFLSINAASLLFEGYAPFQAPNINPVVGIPTNTFGISISANASITVTASSTSGNVVFSQSSFKFTNDAQLYSFSYSSNVAGADEITFSISGPDSGLFTPVNVGITVALRNFVLSALYNQLDEWYINTATGALVISVDYPPPTGVTITPTSPNFQFNPPFLSFSPTTNTAQFTFTASSTGLKTISWTVSGSDSAWYAGVPDKSVLIDPRPFVVVFPVQKSLAVGQTSSPVTVYTQYPPESDVSVSVALIESCPYGSASIVPSNTLKFTPTSLSASFSVSSAVQCSYVELNFTVTGTNANEYAPPSTLSSFEFGQLSLTVTSTDPNFALGLSDLQCGFSTSLALTVSAPPPNGFQVALSAPGAIFTPSTLTFSPTVLSNSFGVQSTFIPASGNININYQVSGADAQLIQYFSGTSIPVAAKTITLPAASAFLTVGSTSSFYASTTTQPVHVVLNYPPASSLTVSAQAAGLVFSPSSLTFGPGDTDMFFTVTAALPGTFDIQFTSSGADAGCYSISTETVDVTVVPLSMIITPSSISQVAVGVLSPVYTISIPGLQSDLTITPVDIDVNGNPQSSVTFTPAMLSLTAAAPSAPFQFTFTTNRPTSDQFNFQVSGASAAYVTPFFIAAPVVSLGKFNTPPNLNSVASGGFAPTQFVIGVPSLPLLVTVSAPPSSDVSLTPYAPATVFTPATLSFSPTTLSATFTVTVAEGTDPSNLNTGGLTKTITWTVSGTNAALYQTPATQSFLAILRSISVASANAVNAINPFVNAPIPLTVSTPYAPTSTLTVTPSGSFTFSPSTITLESSTTAGTFTATPTVAGTSVITFTTSGAESGDYAQIPSLTFTTTLSSFSIVTPSGTPLTLYYGEPSEPFYVQALVAPTTSVTVSIYSQQVAVTPSSFTFTPSSTFAYFTVTPVPGAFATIDAGSAGYNVQLSSAVSGSDAALYSAPAVVSFSARVVAPARTLLYSPTSLSIPIGRPVSFTVSSQLPPASSVTITPFILEVASEFTISPASATLTPSDPIATFTVTLNTYPGTTSSNIIMSVSGPDAYLYSNNAPLSISLSAGSVTVSSTTNMVVNNPYSTFVTLSQAPASDLTVTPYVIVGQPVTFSPTELTFTAGETSALLTITPTVPGSTRIAFTNSGDSAGQFSFENPIDVVVSPGTIKYTPAFTFSPAGNPTMITFSLNAPTLNGFTITPNAPGINFNPETITFAAGSTTASTIGTPLASSLSGYVLFALGGTDATLFTNPCAVLYACYYSSSYGTVSAYVSASSAMVQKVTFTATAQPSSLVITPSAAGVTFVPSSVGLSGSATQATVTAYSTIAGTVNMYYNLSGDGAAAFLPVNQYAANVVLTFSPYTITASTLSTTGVVVGTPSFPVFLTAPVPAWPGIPAVTITPQASVPDVVFTPASVTIDSTQTPAELSASFTFTTTSVGAFTITYILDGPGASAYAIGTTTATSVMGTFTIITPQNLIADGAGSTSNFIYSVPSSAFTVSTPYLPANVTLQLISSSFIFTPSQLNFYPGMNTASFTVTPIQVGPATIGFNVVGESAALFLTPAPLTGFRVLYKISFPQSPVLTVGVESSVQTVTISPTPNNTFLLDIGASNIVFSPSRLVFGTGNPKATFTAYGTAVTIATPYATNVPGTAPAVTSSTATLTLAGTDGTEGAAVTYQLQQPYSLYVGPGIFRLSHPRYQMEVKTKISVQISTPPRSDVALTFFGNNMQFDPPYIVFTHNGATTQDVSVTPRAASSYEVNYESFKVDYALSGTNRYDYVTPAETYHYIALSQGYIAAIILMSLLGAIVLIAGCLVLTGKHKVIMG